MTGAHRVFLSFGANLGNRQEQIEAALHCLTQLPGFRLEAQSSYYETEPQDVRDQPWFLNLVASGRTDMAPESLLKHLQAIERSLGRERGAPHEQTRGPRSIDIDILLFDNLLLQSPRLTIPHGRMNQRRFVLEPLCELLPNGIDPASGRSFASLLAVLHSQQVRRLD